MLGWLQSFLAVRGLAPHGYCLEATVGPDILIDLQLGEALPCCMVDKSQLEIALVNLAVNARDAMTGSGGGTIIITTRRHSPDSLELSVADTGCGMDDATRERAADPFFTTKPLGKGTGLGLSQVVGTVEQMGGCVEIESQPGTGTTVRLFFDAKMGVQ